MPLAIVLFLAKEITQLVVRGPAICGGERKLDFVGKIGADHTLSLL